MALQLGGVGAAGQHALVGRRGTEGGFLAHEEEQRRREKVHRLAVADGGVAVRVRVEEARNRRPPPRAAALAERAPRVGADETCTVAASGRVAGGGMRSTFGRAAGARRVLAGAAERAHEQRVPDAAAEREDASLDEPCSLVTSGEKTVRGVALAIVWAVAVHRRALAAPSRAAGDVAQAGL